MLSKTLTISSPNYLLKIAFQKIIINFSFAKILTSCPYFSRCILRQVCNEWNDFLPANTEELSSKLQSKRQGLIRLFIQKSLIQQKTEFFKSLAKSSIFRVKIDDKRVARLDQNFVNDLGILEIQVGESNDLKRLKFFMRHAGWHSLKLAQNQDIVSTRNQTKNVEITAVNEFVSCLVCKDITF